MSGSFGCVCVTNPTTFDHGMPVASNVDIALHFDDVSDEEATFKALSEGGQVTTELQDTFWGARFGTLTDRFGVRWMFNCELKKA